MYPMHSLLSETLQIGDAFDGCFLTDLSNIGLTNVFIPSASLLSKTEVHAMHNWIITWYLKDAT